MYWTQTVYELSEEKVGKEEVKTMLKQELLDELVTKREFYSEIKRLEEKLDEKVNTLSALRSEMVAFKSEMKAELKRLEEKIDWKAKRLELILYFLGVLMVVLNKGTVEYILRVFNIK